MSVLILTSGMEVGIAGMQIGGERELTIPSPMGYGKKKMPGIPAGSTLTFGEQDRSLGT